MKGSKPINIFLDSGAFSAMTKKVVIDLDKYIDFIKEYQDKLEVYANLDVIGDAVGTWKNQKYMESKGLRPMPVFHSMFEDDEWLLKYMEDYDYIGIGGIAGTGFSKENLTQRLDEIFEKYICPAPSRMPVVKIHGFGMTSFSLMLRYPWYSVDSTSWIITGRTGSILVPPVVDGKLSYSRPPIKVDVSNRSPNVSNPQNHLHSMSKGTRETILEYIRSKGYRLGKSEFMKVDKDYQPQSGERWLDKSGIEEEEFVVGTRRKRLKKKEERDKANLYIIERVVTSGVSNDYQKRDELNIIYFADLERSRPKWPWPFKVNRRMGFGI
jgi:hypothetical protein